MPKNKKQSLTSRAILQMRTLFLNKVAAPIANKMFDCGMIP